MVNKKEETRKLSDKNRFEAALASKAIHIEPRNKLKIVRGRIELVEYMKDEDKL